MVQQSESLRSDLGSHTGNNDDQSPWLRAKVGASMNDDSFLTLLLFQGILIMAGAETDVNEIPGPPKDLGVQRRFAR
jgi:hypothetical protein